MDARTAIARAGQVLVAGFPGTEAPERLRSALAEGELAGVTLFKRNIQSVEQTTALLSSMAAPASAPALFAVDQEGGRVARLGPPVLQLPPMRRLGDHGDLDLTRDAAACLGRHLRAIGFTMDFAPVLDVDTNPDNPVIGDRAFGSTPEVVAAHALAFSAGLMSAGVLSCGKHFPGHGDTHLDSHLELPSLPHDRGRLDSVELAPFRAALALPAFMTAHVVFEALDPGVPATLSRRVIQGLLREELGYEGCIISDDLEMKAVAEGFGIVPSAVRAIEAGCDMLLICSDLDACFAARDALAGRAQQDEIFAARLSDAAARSLRLRRTASTAKSVGFDIPPELAARLGAL